MYFPRNITHPRSLFCLNKDWGCVIFREIDFLLKICLIDSLLTPIAESTYLNRDMCKFESSQKDESRWQSTDSSKAYRNTSAFKCKKHCLALSVSRTPYTSAALSRTPTRLRYTRTSYTSAALWYRIAKIRSGPKKVQDCWSRLNASRAARNSFAGRMFVTPVLEEGNFRSSPPQQWI